VNRYVADAMLYLIDVVSLIVIVTVLLRLLLQLVRADFYNPISQVLVKFTNPLLRPLRRLIPGFGGIDVPSLVLLLALEIAALAMKASLVGAALSVPALVLSGSR
jgi:YggT family protein